MKSWIVRTFAMFVTAAACAAVAEPALACGPYVPETPEQRASAAVARTLAKLPAAARPVLKSLWTDGDLAVARVEHPKNRQNKLLVMRMINGDFRVVSSVLPR